MDLNSSTASDLNRQEAVRYLLAEGLNCQDSDLLKNRIQRFLELPPVLEMLKRAEADLVAQWNGSAAILDAPPVPDAPAAVFPRVEDLGSLPMAAADVPPTVGALPTPVVVPRQTQVGKPLMLPNACVGKPFETKIQLLQNTGEAFVAECPEALEMGLVVASNDLDGNLVIRLAGTPTKAGDLEFTLILKGLHLDLKHQIKWTVNPDPKSLWKSIPSKQTELFWKPDSDCKLIQAGGRTLVAASQRGRSHGHEGICRDDDFKIKYIEGNGWYLIAVADGAGSSKFSRQGAHTASLIALEHMEKALTPEREKVLTDYLADHGAKDIATSREVLQGLVWETVGNAAFGAYKALQQETAACAGSVLKDFATTLLLGAVKEIPGVGWFVMTYWVGDGGIGVYDAGAATVKLMGTPDEGEFAGQTRFLTMSDLWASEEVMSRIRFQIFPTFTSMVWMTDGITDPIFQTDNNLNDPARWQAFHQQLVNEAGLIPDVGTNLEQKLLTWLDFWSQGNHDDRTLAILL